MVVFAPMSGCKQSLNLVQHCHCRQTHHVCFNSCQHNTTQHNLAVIQTTSQIKNALAFKLFFLSISSFELQFQMSILADIRKYLN